MKKLQRGDTIGVVAPSDIIEEKDLEEYKDILFNL